MIAEESNELALEKITRISKQAVERAKEFAATKNGQMAFGVGLVAVGSISVMSIYRWYWNSSKKNGGADKKSINQQIPQQTDEQRYLLDWPGIDFTKWHLNTDATKYFANRSNLCLSNCRDECECLAPALTIQVYRCYSEEKTLALFIKGYVTKEQVSRRIGHLVTKIFSSYKTSGTLNSDSTNIQSFYYQIPQK